MSADFEVIDKKPGHHKVCLSEGGKKARWLTIIDLKMHQGAGKITAGGIAPRRDMAIPETLFPKAVPCMWRPDRW